VYFQSDKMFGFLFLGFVASFTLALAQSPTVTIASGVVVGKTATPSNQPSVTATANVYQGIPFAQSPPERFSPPSAPAAWSSPLQATQLPPACIQQFEGKFQSNSILHLSEDPHWTETGIAGSGASRQFTIDTFDNPGGEPLSESEDCLYVNVYAPAGASLTSQKPVLFWLFGVSP
jgi:carboxylesterase 2